MKRVLLLGLFLLACAGTLRSQGVPQSMTYQGYVTDVAGTPVADGSYSFTFALYTSEVAGAQVWTESHTNVGVEKGLFTVQLGRGNPPMPFTIAFDQQYYLGIRIGANPELSPRVRLATSAYSFRAKMADNVPPWSILDSHVGPTANIAASKLQSTVLTESEIVAGSGVTINNAGGTLTISASGGAVALGGDVTGPAASNTIADNAVTAAKIAPNIVSSISGVSNDGGDIALVAGANVTITPNDAANTVTIAASGGGGGGLTLPYAGTASSSSAAMKIEQTGTGMGGWFFVSNASSNENAIYASNNSTTAASAALRAIAEGGAAVEAVNNSTSSPALTAFNSNSGPVAVFGNSSTSAGNIVTINKSGGSGKGLNIAYTGTSNAVYIDNNSSGTGLELRQDGSGKAAYFHIENTTSSENALLVESKSTNTSSDAVQASAVGGRAFYGTSAGASTTTAYITNTGGGRAIYGQNNSTASPAITASNLSSSANVKLFTANSSLGEVFAVDREGDVAADGTMNADAFVATETRTSAPEKGGVYKNSVVHAWARISSSGAIVESFGVSSVARAGNGMYALTFSNPFPSGTAMCATASAYTTTGPRVAVIANYTTNYLEVWTYSSSGTLADSGFSVIIVGQY